MGDFYIAMLELHLPVILGLRFTLGRLTLLTLAPARRTKDSNMVQDHIYQLGGFQPLHITHYHSTYVYTYMYLYQHTYHFKTVQSAVNCAPLLRV